MDIFAERAELRESLKAALETLKKDGTGREQVETLTVELREVEEKCAAIEKSDALLRGLGEVNAKAAESEEEPRTVGEFFVKHAAARAKAASNDRAMSVSTPEFKAATDIHKVITTPQGIAPVEYDYNFVRAYEYPLTIADWLGSSTLSKPVLTYFVEKLVGGREGDFGWVAEGGKKPQLHYGGFEEVTESLKKLAGYIKVSTEMLDDQEFMISELNQRLLLDLKIKEEQALLNGDGTSNGLKGLLQRSNLQTENASSFDENADAIFRALTKVRSATGLIADGIVINPEDYEKLRLAKDANRQYYAGGPFYSPYGGAGQLAEFPQLWGKRMIVTPAIEKGTAIVGAGKQGATVYRKGGVTLNTAFQNEDDFVHNLATILVEERIALAVRRPTAFVKVTLASE